MSPLALDHVHQEPLPVKTWTTSLLEKMISLRSNADAIGCIFSDRVQKALNLVQICIAFDGPKDSHDHLVPEELIPLMEEELLGFSVTNGIE